MISILLITTIVCIFFVGFVFLTLFNFVKNESIIEKFSYAWVIGVGIIGLQMFFYSILKIEWSSFSILLPWILFFIYLLSRKITFPKINIRHRVSRIEITFAVLILVLLFFTGFESILRPVQAWDAWDNWLLRSKIYFLHNNLDLDYVRYTNDEYPLIIPLMGTFGYMMMGEINDRYILLLFFMFYLALGGLFFANGKKLFGTRKALIFTFLLLSLQNLIRHGGRYEAGQADLALGCYIFATTMLLAKFIKTKNKKTLIILSILLGITGQIKNDGMAFFVTVNVIILFSLVKWKMYKYILVLLPSFIIILPWELYKSFYHYPQNFIFRSGIHVHTDKIVAILLAMAKEFLNLQNWSILWIVFFLALAINWKKIGKVKIFLTIVIFQWLSYYAVFLITPREPIGHVQNIIDKLYIHLAPLAVFIIGILINAQFIRMKKSSFTRYRNFLQNLLK